jgi:glucokinase
MINSNGTMTTGNIISIHFIALINYLSKYSQITSLAFKLVVFSPTIALGKKESEPGQCAFAPLTPRQLAILVHLWDRYPRVTADHLLSGPGLCNIYSAIVMLNTGKTAEALAAAEIVSAARHGDQLARQSLDEFSRMLGAVCGDIALSMGSLGGFFLTGAMLQKLDELFSAELFMAAFTDKGSFSDWCRRVPVAMLTIPDPGLRGCAAFSRQ